MKHITSLVAMLLLATAAPAEAGGQEGSLGVGAEFGLGAILDGNSIGGASLNYDAGMFHVGGFLGFADAADEDSVYTLGGRFYYHVHSMASSDFGVGGQVGLLSLPTADPDDDRATAMYIEPAVQIRAFLATNVALSFNVGLVIGTIDAEGFAIGGLPSGAAGFHYYFF